MPLKSLYCQDGKGLFLLKKTGKLAKIKVLARISTAQQMLNQQTVTGSMFMKKAEMIQLISSKENGASVG